MASRYALAALFAACALLPTGPVAATGTRPAAPQSRHPAPAHCTAAGASATGLVAALSAPLPAPTSPTVCLTGTIRSADGQPRPGACVFPTTNHRLIAVTDATGKFSLQVPATAGPVHLQADYFGLGSSRFEVDGQHPQPVSIVLGQ